jgi:iron complex outermembrane recepter protein
VQSTMSYLDYFRFQPNPDANFSDSTGTIGNVANPNPTQDTQFDYRILTNFAYQWSGFGVGMTWRHLPSVDNQAQVTSPTSTVRGTGSYNLFNVFGSFSTGKYTFRLGVDNVLDKEPLIVGPNPGIDSNSDMTNPSFYDPLGRRYYVGVKASF